MITVIKDICIFMMIAQTLLLMVPGNSYMKYVRILVGIMMILFVCRPLVSWVFMKEGPAMEQVLSELEKGMPGIEEFSVTEEGGIRIYDSIEEELKYKLNQTINSEYYVRSVELRMARRENDIGQEEVIENIRITVEETYGKENEIVIKQIKIGSAKEDERKSEELKQKFGECIGIAPERLEVDIVHG